MISEVTCPENEEDLNVALNADSVQSKRSNLILFESSGTPSTAEYLHHRSWEQRSPMQKYVDELTDVDEMDDFTEINGFQGESSEAIMEHNRRKISIEKGINIEEKTTPVFLQYIFILGYSGNIVWSIHTFF